MPSGSLRTWTIAIGLSAGVWVAPSIGADPAWTLNGAANSVTSSGGSVVGTEFTLNQKITVTDLGWYDNPLSSAGLNVAIDLGIFDASTEQLLVSATVPSGTAADLVDNFRYIPVTPTMLSAGGTYIVAGVWDGTDPLRNVTPGASMIENSVLSTSRWVEEFTDQLEFPTVQITTVTRTMGPNFLFVPEPGSLGLLAVGAYVVCRRRR